MAYRVRADNAAEFAQGLVDNGVLEEKYLAAFAAVDRAFFFPDEQREEAYMDAPLRVGTRHQSAPHIYANALASLDPRPGQSFLNVGSGTGYFSAIVGFITGLRGVSHGVEISRENVSFARRSLAQIFSQRGVFVPINFHAGSIYDLDAARNIMYDRIYIGFGCPASRIPFFQQMLRDGGVLFGPFDFGLPFPGLCQVLTRIVRKGDSFDLKKLTPARFADGQSEEGLAARFVLSPRGGWSADTHHLYPTAFRTTARALLLCLRHAALPDDLLLPLLAFVPPSWTPLQDTQGEDMSPRAVFDIGAVVSAHGLTGAVELNGLRGVVVSLNEGQLRNRIGVNFGEPHGRKALRAGNLTALSPSPSSAGSGSADPGEAGGGAHHDGGGAGAGPPDPPPAVASPQLLPVSSPA